MDYICVKCGFETEDVKCRGDECEHVFAENCPSCSALRARLALAEKVVEELLPMLSYIDATPDEGFLPGEFQVIKARAVFIRAALAALSAKGGGGC